MCGSHHPLAEILNLFLVIAYRIFVGSSLPTSALLLYYLVGPMEIHLGD
jgi:hypothetical protein